MDFVFDENCESDPPEGNGYQLWTTTTDQPMSPVFETPEGLARWLHDTKASSFGCETRSYNEWLEFIKGPGWAPSMIITNGEIRTGIDATLDQ